MPQVFSGQKVSLVEILCEALWCCWLDRISQSHLGERPLGMPLEDGPDYLNWGGNISHCGQHHFMGWVLNCMKGREETEGKHCFPSLLLGYEWDRISCLEFLPRWLPLQWWTCELRSTISPLICFCQDVFLKQQEKETKTGPQKKYPHRDKRIPWHPGAQELTLPLVN